MVGHSPSMNMNDHVFFYQLMYQKNMRTAPGDTSRQTTILRVSFTKSMSEQHHSKPFFFFLSECNHVLIRACIGLKKNTYILV